MTVIFLQFHLDFALLARESIAPIWPKIPKEGGFRVSPKPNSNFSVQNRKQIKGKFWWELEDLQGFFIPENMERIG